MSSQPHKRAAIFQKQAELSHIASKIDVFMHFL